MKLSIIIPVYNAARYLHAAIDSLLAQTRRDWEALCVDDGSTDASAAILAEYAARDSRFKVIRQQNAGQGAARNRGLELARGEFIYFLDADDELNESDIFERLIAEMEAHRLDVIFFDAESKVDDGLNVPPEIVRPTDYIRLKDYCGVYSGRELLSRFLKNNEYCVVPWLMLLRREFIEANQLRFPNENYYYEDNIFTLRVMLAAERASHRPWRGYLRKAHAGSTVTSRPTPRHINGYRACLEDVRRLLARGDWDSRTRLLLREREMVYLHQIHRLEGTPRPLGERLVGYYLCLRCRGVGYIVKRIFQKLIGPAKTV